MKNTILLVLLYLFCLSYVNSQTHQRQVFDNFEVTNGVRAAPAAASLPVSLQTENKTLIKKTAQIITAGSDIWNQKSSQAANERLINKTAMTTGNSLAGFTTGDLTIDSYIAESSARYDIDPLLIYAQMHQESGFKRRATSYKGASGLMQLMPATAMRFGVKNIYDPKQNIDAGIKYMRWLINKFNGDLNLALAGYNAGEGAVMKYGNQIPPYNETRQYVKKITAHYNSIKKLNRVETASKVLQQNPAAFDIQQPAASSAFERNALTVLLPNGQTRLTNF